MSQDFNYIKIRARFRAPYIQNVASMRLTEIGMAAEELERTLKGSNKEPAKKAAMFINGLLLRISRNIMTILTPEEAIALANQYKVNLQGLDEYHLVEVTEKTVNMQIHRQSGCSDIKEYATKYGFMTTVMTVVEIGNILLKNMYS